MNHQIKNHIGLLSAICGSLLLSVPAIAQTNSTPKPSQTRTSSEMCVPNTDATSSSVSGSSSVNSNRNTPTTASARNNDNDRVSNTDTDNDSRTTEGSSSANSNRNTPTTDTSATVEEPSSTGGDSAAISDRNNTSASSETCAVPNNTDRNITAPSSGSPNLDKQIRRNNSRIISPTPEQRQAASAIVRPASGMVNIKLVNETGANIVYEAIGETNQRNLQGQTTITLQRLDTPSTITFYRADGGLLRVRPQAVAPGVLEVRFAATTDLGIDKNSLTVQPSGSVYLN